MPLITRKEAARLAKRTLSQRRYEHTRNVEKLAVRLAERNGVSEEKSGAGRPCCTTLPKSCRKTECCS